MSGTSAAGPVQPERRAQPAGRGAGPRLVVLALVLATAAAAQASERTSPPPPRPADLALAALPGAEAETGTPAAPAAASGTATAEPSRAMGQVTGLPLPRYVSLRAGEGNARRGPALSHRVDWVFTRRDMPLRVTAEFGHWRRIEDAEGAGGWMHFALLSGVRTALVIEEMTPLHLQADARAPVVALLEAGVIARVLTCDGDWCRLRAEGLRGWAPQSALWGVDSGEQLD